MRPTSVPSKFHQTYLGSALGDPLPPGLLLRKKQPPVQGQVAVAQNPPPPKAGEKTEFEEILLGNDTAYAPGQMHLFRSQQ
mgnify:CR=1 FL=1